MLTCWVKLQGHCETHPTTSVLKDCWKRNDTNILSFIPNAELHQLQYSPTISVSTISSWLFNRNYKAKQIKTWRKVKNYLDKKKLDSVFIFTDGSKDPATGCAGAAVYFPVSETYI